jgi:hypothetical protein
MKLSMGPHPVYLRALATIAILFGLATLRAGGGVLFGDDEVRIAAGDYVVFVVWFNFLAGFAYITAGTGLAFRQPWAVRMSWIIALATLVVFVAFSTHIMAGGAFESRTVGAMTLRSSVWLAIAIISWRILRKEPI